MTAQEIGSGLTPPPAPGVETAPTGVPGRTARGVTFSMAISLVVRLAGIGIGMYTTYLLAHALSVADYGAMSLALSLATAAAQTADFGIAVTGAARIARGDQVSAGRTLSTGLAMRTVASTAAAVGLGAVAIAGVFGGSSLVVAVTAISVPLSATAVLTAGSTARFRPEVASVLMLLQGVFWLVAVAAVKLTGGSLLTLAWLFVVATTLQTIVGLLLNRRIVPLGRPSWREVSAIFAVSWPMAVSSIAYTAYYRLDSVILNHARGYTELSFYMAGWKFVDVAQLAPTVLVAPLLPLAAISMAMDEERRRKILSLATRTSLAIGIGAAGLLISIAPGLIGFIYGKGYEPAVRPLELLALAYVGISVGYVGSTVLTGLRKTKPIALVCVVAAVVSLAGQAWATPRWGATGAATVTAITQVGIAIVYSVLAARAMRTRLPLLEICLGTLLLVVVIGGAALIHLPWPVEAVAVAAALGVGLVLTRVITVSDFRRVLARRAVS